MKPYFDTDARKDQLWQVAQKWKGTPFHAHSASIGHGVDCVRLAHAIMQECGACGDMELPPYSLDYAHHATRSQLLTFLLSESSLKGRLAFIPLWNARAGDLLGMRSGRHDHHMAVVLPWEKVIHAIEGKGVVVHDLREKNFYDRILYVMRVMEAEQ